jgi:hypothetical protein
LWPPAAALLSLYAIALAAAVAAYALTFAQIANLPVFLVLLLLPPAPLLAYPPLLLAAIAARAHTLALAARTLAVPVLIHAAALAALAAYTHLDLQAADTLALLPPAALVLLAPMAAAGAGAVEAHIRYTRDVAVCRRDFLSYVMGRAGAGTGVGDDGSLQRGR